MKVVIQKTADLVKMAAPYNPRRISEHDLESLRRSLRFFGVVEPIVVNRRTQRIVGGHQRVVAAQAEGIDELPVVFVDLDEPSEKQLNLALNRISGDWDEDKLAAVLRELEEAGADLDLTGFDSEEIDRLLEEIEDKAKGYGHSGVNPEYPEWRNEALKKAALKAREEIRCFWERWRKNGPPLAPDVTRGDLLAAFIRAYTGGGRIPSYLTLAYNPHRLIARNSGKQSIDVLFDPATGDDSVARSFLSLIGETGLGFWANLIRTGLPVGQVRIPRDMRSDFACGVITTHGGEHSKVLDPCHGWGGRLLGWHLARGVYYCGIDACKETNDGVRAMHKDILEMLPPEEHREAVLIYGAFEEADFPVPDGGYDLVFTSPPYFDREIYEGELQSTERYGDYDAWVDGFLRPMIERSLVALRPGGRAVFNVAGTFGKRHLPSDTKNVAVSAGFEFLRFDDVAWDRGMFDKHDENREVLVVLRKKD